MTASPHFTAPGDGLVTSSPAVEPAQAMAVQMADVAGAMFALQLLRAPDLPAHTDVLHPPTAELAASLVVSEEPDPPVLIPSVPALAVAIAALDLELDASPTPVGIPSIAMPTSLPMPDLLPQLNPEQVDEEESAAPDLAIPLVATMAPHTMAMLSEIGFLDE